MPITEHEKSTIVAFGHGDVVISHGKQPERKYSNEVLLFQPVADDGELVAIGPTGELIPQQICEAWNGKNSDELAVPVRLAFDNLAGVDSLLLSLLELREKLRTKSELPAVIRDTRWGGKQARHLANLRSLAESDNSELAELAKEAVGAR